MTYAIENGFGDVLAQGFSDQDAARACAQRIANDHHASVWLYEEGEASAEDGEAVAPQRGLDVRECIEAVTVTCDGDELISYSAVYCAIVADLDGTAAGGCEVSYPPNFSRERARRVLEALDRETADEIYNAACAGTLALPLDAKGR